MQQYLNRFLLVVSLLLASLWGHAQNEYVVALPDGRSRCEYKMTIGVKAGEVDGVLIVRRDSIEGFRAALMNEFGISALTFRLTADRSRVVLVDVVSFLDKWYIRKVLTADLQYLFAARETDLTHERDKRVVSREADSIVMNNRKFGLCYKLTPIKEHKDETD